MVRFIPRNPAKAGSHVTQELIVAMATVFFLVLAVSVGGAQTQSKTPSKARKPAQPKTIVAQPEVICPAILGVGINTHRDFCDVLVGRDPQTGIIVRLPQHRGPLVLTFDLHNRETYSEELVRERRAYAHHTATIGVLTMDGALLTRGVVDTEFRSAADLLDRVGGGAGPSGVKAVAPIGDEPIRVEVPEGVDDVSVLGEKLRSVTPDGSELFTGAGRPIAIISNIQIEYRPAPARKTPAKKAPAKKKG